MAYQVLIADNNSMFSLGVESVLKRILNDYVAHKANDGLEAQRILDEGSIDLVVINLYLPKKNDLQVFEESREKSPQTRFVVYNSQRGPNDPDLDLHYIRMITKYGLTPLHADSSTEAFEKAIRTCIEESKGK